MIAMEPIGIVHSARGDLDDDNWGDVVSTIELRAEVAPESLDGLDAFSHAEIVFVFDRVAPDRVVAEVRHPRNNPAWPKVGIFAQRAKARPNRIGTTIVRIVKRTGRTLEVAGLDAVDGTPVLDIKPVMSEFLPRETVHQPAWSRELMANYWHTAVKEPE
jgi:tRNA (adenine37-N6)-methyltransferase